MNTKDLIGKIIYQQNGALITGRKITSILPVEEGKHFAVAAMPDKQDLVHVGPTNSEEALVRLVMSMTGKPAIGQADPIFAGYAAAE